MSWSCLLLFFLSPQETRDLEALRQLDGFEKLLPKGRIAAIRQPELVAADKADLPDDAWVIGVAADGVAKAYSINLLNRHEIVNDFVGGKPIAVTW